MILTGRRVSAQEGYDLGFVNEVVPHAELLPAAKRWAAQILECSPLSVRASKEAVLRGFNLDLQAALEARYDGIAAMVRSEDFVEGPRAFAQKRPPQWKGK
jgi:crotonobetainyl-CoA hydratase